jgi:hypothetical protein
LFKVADEERVVSVTRFRDLDGEEDEENDNQEKNTTKVVGPEIVNVADDVEISKNLKDTSGTDEG